MPGAFARFGSRVVESGMEVCIEAGGACDTFCRSDAGVRGDTASVWRTIPVATRVPTAAPGRAVMQRDGSGSVVEKLERILDAEERAADLIAEARERAIAIDREARAEAVRVHQELRSEARAAVEQETDELLSRTHDEADAIAAQASAARAAIIDAAQVRVPDAVAAVLRGLAD